MRYLMLLVLTFMAVMLGQVDYAWSQQDSQDLQLPSAPLLEQQLDEATVRELAEKIEIKLSSGKVYELSARPADEDEMAPFRSLTGAKQADFKARRLQFLTQVARVLNASKFALGAGSLVGKSFSFLKNSVKGRLGYATEINTDSATFKERSHRVVQALLTAFDRQLWSQAPLLVNSNEYGLSASVAVIALGGYFEKGAGGIQELGVSFAYNRDSKSAVFELFHTSEKFSAAEPFTAVLAVAPKVGISIRENSGETSKMQSSGIGRGLPVLPAYMSAGPDNLTISGMLTLGVPPSPIADMLPGYSTRFEKNTLIRIRVSPLVPGYIRVEFGDVRGVLVGLKTSFSQAWNDLSLKIRTLRSGSCSKVFAFN